MLEFQESVTFLQNIEVQGSTTGISYTDLSNKPTIPTAIATGTITPRDDDINLSGGSIGDVITVQADGSLALSTPAGGLEHITETYLSSAPNNTVNHVNLAATGDTTNVSMSIRPKGSGAFIVGPPPDGTTTGGNVRGAYAVDLQTLRDTNTQVASGGASVVVGRNNTASGQDSVALGLSNIASSVQSLCIGSNNQATQQGAIAIGIGSVASAPFSVNIGSFCTSAGLYSLAVGFYASTSALAQYAVALGPTSLADRRNILAFGNWWFSVAGDSQRTLQSLRGTTTNTTPTELFIDGDRFTIPTGKTLRCRVEIHGIRSDGSAVSSYERRVIIKNVGGTTSLVGSVLTIGTDHEDAATAIDITADDTNDSMKVTVTGIASQTWRWMASIESLELSYGT
jgi:hypothetical protein